MKVKKNEGSVNSLESITDEEQSRFDSYELVFIFVLDPTIFIPIDSDEKENQERELEERKRKEELEHILIRQGNGTFYEIDRISIEI